MISFPVKIMGYKFLNQFIRGCSITANTAVLGVNEVTALQWIKDEGVIDIDPPKGDEKFLESLDDNDKAGRYRLLKGKRPKAIGLINDLEKEIAGKS